MESENAWCLIPCLDALCHGGFLVLSFFLLALGKVASSFIIIYHLSKNARPPAARPRSPDARGWWMGAAEEVYFLWYFVS